MVAFTFLALLAFSGLLVELLGPVFPAPSGCAVAWRASDAGWLTAASRWRAAARSPDGCDSACDEPDWRVWGARAGAARRVPSTCRTTAGSVP